MKTFKLILKLFLVVVLICSVILNILIFNSSTGSLIFNKDIPLLRSMIYSDIKAKFDVDITSNIELTNADLIKPKNAGYLYQYSLKDKDGKKERYEYYIYFDEKSSMTYSYNIVDKSGVETTRYLQGNTLFSEVDGDKSRKDISTSQASSNIENILTKIADFYNAADLLYNVAKEEQLNLSLDFSFSPFYAFGVKAEVENNDLVYAFHYDLNGNLRKYSFTDSSENEITIKVTKKTDKIAQQDPIDYPLEKNN